MKRDVLSSVILPRIFGPGIAIVLVIVGILLALRSFPTERAQIERHLIKGDVGHLDTNPTAQFLLSKSKQSGLSDAQVEKLESIYQAETRALVSVNREIETASQRFSEFMDRHESSHLSVLQIQEAGQPLSTILLKKKLLIDKFDVQAVNILNPQQREKVTQPWRTACTIDRRSESKSR